MNISIMSYGPKTYIAHTQIVRISNVSDQSNYEKGFQQTVSYLKEHSIPPIGYGATIYLTWNPEKNETKMAYGFEVQGVGSVQSEDVALISIPECRAIIAEYEGEYVGLKHAHEQVMQYMKDHALEMTGYAIEEYLIGPQQESNSSKWRTNLVYIV